MKELGYSSIGVSGQKAYNGVAIMSAIPLDNIITHLEGMEDLGEARYIESDVVYNKKKYRIISVYVPNGHEIASRRFFHKLSFYSRLEARLKNLIECGHNLIVCGDFNVVSKEIDSYNPQAMHGKLLFTTDEKKCFRRILNLGLMDTFRELNPGSKTFSWWDYRKGSWQQNKGLRIDYILASPKTVDEINSSGIISEVRGWTKPSDHAPLYITM